MERGPRNLETSGTGKPSGYSTIMRSTAAFCNTLPKKKNSLDAPTFVSKKPERLVENEMVNRGMLAKLNGN